MFFERLKVVNSYIELTLNNIKTPMKKFSLIFTLAITLLGVTNLKAQSMDNSTKVGKQISAFPVGEPLPEQFSPYFIGQAYLAPLAGELGTPVSNVTFEPRCRNNWHSHTGGQMLIVLAGYGWYQERGKEAQQLKAGDIVEIPRNVEHWQGATANSWFSHLAVATNNKENTNIWLEPVDDEWYNKLEAPSTANLTPTAIQNHEKWFPNHKSQIKVTDPELIEVFDNFAFDDVFSDSNLDNKTKTLITMASNIAVGATSEYRVITRAALNVGATPTEVKEALYQAVPYVGIARVLDFIHITNEELTARGIALPLPNQATSTRQTRMERGAEVLKDIFGDNQVENMYKNTLPSQRHIQDYLVGNCFGDHVSRSGLDLKTRELLTFSMLISLGGCESQVKGHIRGNVGVGNDKATLLSTLIHLVPYICYPRSLNSVGCLHEVLPE